MNCTTKQQVKLKNGNIRRKSWPSKFDHCLESNWRVHISILTWSTRGSEIKSPAARNCTNTVNQATNSDWRSLQIFQLTKRPKIEVDSLHASEMHILFKFLADRGLKHEANWSSMEIHQGFGEKVFHPTMGLIFPMWTFVFSVLYNTIEIQRKDSRRLGNFFDCRQLQYKRWSHSESEEKNPEN